MRSWWIFTMISWVLRGWESSQIVYYLQCSGSFETELKEFYKSGLNSARQVMSHQLNSEESLKWFPGCNMGDKWVKLYIIFFFFLYCSMERRKYYEHISKAKRYPNKYLSMIFLLYGNFLRKNTLAMMQQMAHQLMAYTYSCQVLTMGMITHDFTNTRKLGDGDRIICLVKYMLLYFKSLKKPEYDWWVCWHKSNAFWPQEKLPMSYGIGFPTLKAARIQIVSMTVNVDVVNLNFKIYGRRLYGQVNQNTIDRISRSCQRLYRSPVSRWYGVGTFQSLRIRPCHF